MYCELLRYLPNSFNYKKVTGGVPPPLLQSEDTKKAHSE